MFELQITLLINIPYSHRIVEKQINCIFVISDGFYMQITGQPGMMLKLLSWWSNKQNDQANETKEQTKQTNERNWALTSASIPYSCWCLRLSKLIGFIVFAVDPSVLSFVLPSIKLIRLDWFYRSCCSRFFCQLNWLALSSSRLVFQGTMLVVSQGSLPIGIFVY